MVRNGEDAFLAGVFPEPELEPVLANIWAVSFVASFRCLSFRRHVSPVWRAGAWPCSWDVDFKLAAPLSTTVEGVFKDGKVVSLTVTPASRKSSVIVMPCQNV